MTSAGFRDESLTLALPLWLSMVRAFGESGGLDLCATSNVPTASMILASQSNPTCRADISAEVAAWFLVQLWSQRSGSPETGLT